MKVEVDIQARDTQGRVFLTWSPVKASARLVDTPANQASQQVTLRNGGTATGGRVAFGMQRTDSGDAEISLNLPEDGSAVEFWVAGEFQRPSSDYGDAAIEVVNGQGPALGRQELMVRIRKNAVKLSAKERDRLLLALGKLNDAGHGPFKGFRESHVLQSEDEAHGYPGFPPWHRAYLLDIERELQLIDPEVALPYWRFDEPAPALFAPEFMGMPPADPSKGDLVQFPHGHALEFWRTDSNDPVERRPLWNIATAPAQSNGGQPGVISQQATLALGTTFAAFRRMEGAPHGMAHVIFHGPINSIPTAPKDPLFFLLHANVDRLWAIWQWLNRRTDPDDPATYFLTGPVRPPGNIGHNLDDMMWPWNGSTTPPRPTFPPPRGPFPSTPVTGRPGPTPKVRDMIDYQGVQAGRSLGFDYDDVPFELHT